MNYSLSEIIQWDTENWGRSIEFWENIIDRQFFAGKKALEIGGREGGLSLWLADKGVKVICSDLQNPEEIASPLHSKCKFHDNISYRAINACSIPYENEFDIIIFKSVLGGIGRDNRKDLQIMAVKEMHKALKFGGILLFAENLQGSIFHKIGRSMFVRWGNSWRYLTIDEIRELFGIFKDVSYKTTGFLGAFGCSEMQRNILGRIDRKLSAVLPASFSYIIYGIAKK